MKLHYEKVEIGGKEPLSNEQLLYALQEKMSVELDKFHDWLLTQPPAEILNHTFEYTTKTDIVLLMDNMTLSDKRLNALLSSPTPLEDAYKAFRNVDTGLVDTIQSCLEDRADTMLNLQQERQREIPKKDSVLGKLHEKASRSPKPHIPARGDNVR